MKHPVHQQARSAGSRAARVAETRLYTALRAQHTAPDLFSDRNEDAAEYAAILRYFERVHDEAADADRYN